MPNRHHYSQPRVASITGSLRRSPVRSSLALACLLTAVFAIVASIPAPRASAHALLVRSTPAANDRLSAGPSTIDLWFSEPLDRSFSRVEVRDQNGQRIDEGRVEFNPGDSTQMSTRLRVFSPGIYIVSWRTLSTVDGHQWTGSYPFIVLNPDGSVPEGSAVSVVSQNEVPSPVLSIVRWLELLSGALLLGVLAYVLLIAFPAARSAGQSARADIEGRLRGHAVQFGYWAAGAFALASILGLLLQVQTLGGIGSLVDLIFRSRPGHVWLLRLGLVTSTVMLLTTMGIRLSGSGKKISVVALLAILAAFLLATSGYGWTVMVLVLVALGLIAYTLSRGKRPEELFSGRAPLVLAMLCAGGAVLTFSLMSHAGAVNPGSFWAIAADSVHIVAVSLWIGGLVGTPFVFFVTRGLEGSERIGFLARSVARFSPYAATNVAIIIATGIFSSAVEVPSLQAMGDTVYGRVLIAKLALFGVMLIVAALNAFVLGPRLVRVAEGQAASDGGLEFARARTLRRRLLRTIAFEATLGILVLASVGVLTQVPPSRTSIAAGEARPQVEEQGPFEQTVRAGDTEVTLQVAPNNAGINQYRVRVGGVDPQEVLRVRVTFLTTDQTFGGSSGVAERVGEAEWLIEGPYFTFGGPWQVIVDLRRVEKDDVTAAYRLLVGGPLPPKTPAGGSAFALPELAIQPNLLIGAYAVAAGLGLLFWRRRKRNLGRLSAPALGASALSIFIGIMLVFGVHTHLRPVESSPSQLESGPEAAARGAVIYEQNCAQCHGVTGKGNGPLAPTLNPRPVDLTIHVPFHPDEQILFWVSNGLPGTAMPAFREALTEQERYDVLQYLRELSVPQTQ